METPPPRSAGVVVLHWAEDGPRCLLLRAYRNWDFPKGLIEPGEEPLQTAIRETAEETGLQDLQFRWGPVFRETVPYSGGKIARYYLAETKQNKVILPISPELGRPEHHEHRWTSFDAACQLLPIRLQPILEWAREVISQAS